MKTVTSSFIVLLAIVGTTSQGADQLTTVVSCQRGAKGLPLTGGSSYVLQMGVKNGKSVVTLTKQNPSLGPGDIPQTIVVEPGKTAGTTVIEGYGGTYALTANSGKSGYVMFYYRAGTQDNPDATVLIDWNRGGKNAEGPLTAEDLICSSKLD